MMRMKEVQPIYDLYGHGICHGYIGISLSLSESYYFAEGKKPIISSDETSCTSGSDISLFSFADK